MSGNTKGGGGWSRGRMRSSRSKRCGSCAGLRSGSADQDGRSPSAIARSTSSTTASPIASLRRPPFLAQPRRRSSSTTFGRTVRFTDALLLLPRIGSSVDPGNARVGRRPFLMSATISAPRAMASSAQRRAAAWNARRHDSRQKRCARPPPCRTRNGRLHQEQECSPLIEASAEPCDPPVTKCDGARGQPRRGGQAIERIECWLSGSKPHRHINEAIREPGEWVDPGGVEEPPARSSATGAAVVDCPKPVTNSYKIFLYRRL